MFTNAHKLAAVLSEWMRPAISQIAVQKLTGLPYIANMETMIKHSGIVGQNYCIANDVMPFMRNATDILILPIIEQHLKGIPDAAIPQLAHSIVGTASQQPTFSILDGFLVFEQEDLLELKMLLEKNLPVHGEDTYNVIK